MDEETVQMVLKELKTLRSKNKIHSLPFVKELILYGNEGKNLLTKGSGTLHLFFLLRESSDLHLCQCTKGTSALCRLRNRAAVSKTGS